MPGGFYAPLEVSQHWPVPNYENPELRPNTILILSYILGPLTVALCLVRIWVRVYHQKSAGVDDWLMLAAIVSSYQPRYSSILTITAAYNHSDRSVSS
jgi:hypothetical protein